MFHRIFVSLAPPHIKLRATKTKQVPPVACASPKPCTGLRNSFSHTQQSHGQNHQIFMALIEGSWPWFDIAVMNAGLVRAATEAVCTRSWAAGDRRRVVVLGHINAMSQCHLKSCTRQIHYVNFQSTSPLSSRWLQRHPFGFFLHLTFLWTSLVKEK